MGRIRDKMYPYVVGIIVIGIAYWFHLDPTIKGFDNVLDGLISFSSIFLGFVAALLAIILSISKSPIMNHLYSFTASGGHIDGKTLLFGYFRSSLFTGFFTVIFSIYMFIICNKEKINIFEEWFTYLWIGVTTVFVLTSYRIVSIIMYTLFKHESNPSTYQQITQPETDYSQLQERNTRTIE